MSMGGSGARLLKQELLLRLAAWGWSAAPGRIATLAR
jgi:hypothetical protein